MDTKPLPKLPKKRAVANDAARRKIVQIGLVLRRMADSTKSADARRAYETAALCVLTLANEFDSEVEVQQ